MKNFFASLKNKLTPKPQKRYIVVHHSAGPRTQKAADIINFVLHGRKDLAGKKAYAKIIERDGKVFDFAEETETDVAHATGFNASGIGVCVVGWFDPGHNNITEDDPQFKALVQVCAVLCKRHNIKPENIIGHQDTFRMRGIGIQKSCPGAILHKMLPRLRELVKAYL